MEGDMRELCKKIKNTIRSKHVKGLIVGYPLDLKNEPTRHCEFIQDFLNTLAIEQQLRIPVTLVNEANSSMEAKSLIAARVNMQQQLQLEGGSDLAANRNQQTAMTSPEQYLDPNVMLRKGIYDKVAAKIIL